jgi:hypothetical protein
MWDPKADPDFYKIQGDNEKALDVWEENYVDLLEYEKEHGDCMVPKSFAPNQRLARWVAKQRRHYKAKQENRYHTLTDDKEKRLLDIGFVFNTRTKEILRQCSLKHYEDRWDCFIERLIAFKKEYGHCAVPRRWKFDTQLASWVMRQVSHTCMHAFRISHTFVSHSLTNQQRIQWRSKQQGEHSYLTDERIDQLREIGFVFGAIDRKIYPVDGIKPRVIRTINAAKWKTDRTKTEEASDQEDSDSDEDLDVENDDDSELISSEDGGNDDETETDDSEDEGIRSDEDRNPAAIESDDDAEALKTLAIAATMRVEEI